jgi:hypothetical protein
MRKLALAVLLCSTVSFAETSIEECKIPKPLAGDLSSANAAVAKMRDSCLPKIRKIAECTARTRLLSDSVSGFISKFRKPSATAPLLVSASSSVGSFDVKNSDINIWRNFLSLETQYNQSLDLVKALSEKYKDVETGSSTSMRVQLDTLDYDYNETAKAIARLSENEYKLLIFIENIRRDIQESHDRTRQEVLLIQSSECKDSRMEPVVKQLEAAFVIFADDADLIYQNIMSARIARQNLVNYTYTAIRNKIETAYSVKLMDELSTLGGKIDVILRANRLSAKFENWYSWSIFESNRDKILTTYQQFEGARQILAADLVAAQDFRDQMIAITEAFPETGEFYLNRMNSVVRNLEGQLQRLETRGWGGYLASQKSVANRLVGSANLTPECRALYQGFLDQAASVDTLEKYRVSEKIYMNAVIGCARE